MKFRKMILFIIICFFSFNIVSLASVQSCNDVYKNAKNPTVAQCNQLETNDGYKCEGKTVSGRVVCTKSTQCGSGYTADSTGKCISGTNKNSSNKNSDNSGTKSNSKNNNTSNGNYNDNNGAGGGVDCKSFGQLNTDLQNVFNFIKIVIPILIIVLSTIDFIKAVAGKNEKDLKKAFRILIKRLAYAIVFFFLPVILEQLLKLLGSNSDFCIK